MGKIVGLWWESIDIKLEKVLGISDSIPIQDARTGVDEE